MAEAENPRVDPHYGPETMIVFAHGMDLAHLEGESRGSLLCGADERAQRMHRSPFREADGKYVCDFCVAAADGMEPAAPGPEELDEMVEEKREAAKRFHHSERYA